MILVSPDPYVYAMDQATVGQAMPDYLQRWWIATPVAMMQMT